MSPRSWSSLSEQSQGDDVREASGGMVERIACIAVALGVREPCGGNRELPM